MFEKIKSFLFENKTSKQTIAKNAFWLTMGQVVSRLVRAAILIYAARALGAAQYGVFSYALSLAGFFTLFADLGVSMVLTREAAQKPERKSEFFGTALGLKSILLIFSAALVMFVAPYFSKLTDAKILLPFVALLVIMDGIRDFASAFFRGQEKMEREAYVTVITNVTIAAFGFLILAFSKTAYSLTLTYAVSAGAGTLAGIYLLKNEFIHAVSNFRRELVKPFLQAALPMSLLGILGIFMLNIDMIMLGWWRSAEEIGWYSASQRIMQILYTVPAIFASATFPILSKLIGSGDKNREGQLMEYSMALVLGIAIPIAIGGIILGKEIIGLVFGEAYLPGTLAFQILASTSLLIFPQVLLSNFILAHNQQGKATIAVAFGAGGNVLLNALLIPTYGVAGGAIATFIAQLLNVGILWRLDKKISDFKTLRHLGKIAIASLLMGFVSYFLNTLGLNVILNILISGLIYAGALLLMREKLINEVSSILRA